ncbi:AraC family transcriptional regulator [Roseovarius nubinhibens]|uniref:AraC family transcriptional regulator n=1 Tax=Roseovarius nubinhibens TaxID=314263 RepID=UPI001C09694D|nr:AraC family transcriptional regulator [Roseovarius nubinhibens]MBU3000838.1 AraC family transcriptional regulator [Roseovarius nubinhibens]
MSDLNAPVSPVFINEAFDCARRAGLDAVPIARQIAPDGRMTLAQYGAFWFALAQAMQDEMLGMTAHPMRPGSFALLCHAIRGAPSLGKALERALWALDVMVGAPRGKVSVRNAQACITFADDGPPASAFAYRTLLIVLLGPLSWLARRRLPLVQVAFRCAAPEGAAAYSRLFGTQVQFDAPETQLVIDAAHLTLPVTRSEAALKRYLKQAPGNLLVGYRGMDDVTGQVRALLSRTSPQDWPDFDRLARQFRMSPSTLRRQFKDQGASFRQLTSELRATRARDLLAKTDIPVAEVADLMGYAEPSAFFRAFREWTGCSPAQYRNRQRQT